ncbi:MAG: response regulator transcription factor [Burkholderiales bacterium]|jgi:DNA-binding response OmpR family regulator|nr:response regulator transcription factor [Burkholderiales bacterium]
MRIAVLEDDPVYADLLQTVVRALGHECLLFESGQDLMRQMRRDNFDLLVLDWSVPDATGYEVMEWARAHLKYPVPVLFVTAHGSEREIVAALTAGADDYMVKPVRVPEILARITALLRRSYPQVQNDVAVFGRYTFHVSSNMVEIDGHAVELKQKEFLLAYHLFVNLGRLLSRSYLQQVVWGTDTSAHSRSLDTHLSRVRSLLKLRPDNGFRLTAIYSHGYRLELLAGSTGLPLTAGLPWTADAR